MASIDKVRVIIVGDSGVGKTSLTHLIAHNEALTSPGWTVGCSAEVKLHEYKDLQDTYFIELFDIGGSINHKNARSTFYNPTNGIILVHDLTNRKSHDNLQKWLLEILSKDGKDTFKGHSDSVDLLDSEQFFGSTQIPILVIGTKLDLIDEKSRNKSMATSIATQCGADELLLNSHEARSLAPGTNDLVKLSRFFDKVIERRYYSKETSYLKRKTPFTSPLTSPYGSPFYPPYSSPPTYN